MSSRAASAPPQTARRPPAPLRPTREPAPEWESLLATVTATPGEKLDEATGRAMRARLGHDFADVRIHTGGDADRSAVALDAFAYTFGRHIVFAAGRYAPRTEAGRALLAHELVHFAQQRDATAQAPALASCGSLHEAEADSVATGQRHGAFTPAPLAVARSGASTASPAAGRVLGAQIIQSPPTILLLTPNRVIATPLQYATIPPGEYRITVHLSVPSHNSRWRQFEMSPATPEDAARMHGGGVKFSVSLGRVDPVTLFGTSAVTIPLVVTAGVGELPPVDPNAPPPHALPVADASEQPDPNAPKGDKPKIEQEPREKPSEKPRLIESGSEWGHGESREIDPEKLRVVDAYRASLVGAELGTPGGKTPYSMNLKYDDAPGLAGKVFEAMNPVNYTWELYEADQASRRVGRLESALDEFGYIRKTTAADTAAAQEDEQRALQERDAKALAADLLAEKLESATLAVRYTGAVFNLAADATNPRDWAREVVWPEREGIFVIRVVAQPVDRPQQDGTIIRHRPSIATKAVTVQSPTKIGEQEMLRLMVQLRAMQETDPKERQYWEQQAAEMEQFYAGTVAGYLSVRLGHLESEIWDALAAGDPMRVRALQEQRDALLKQIELAGKREARFKAETYRPQAIIVSEVTGDTYRLLLQLGLTEPEHEGGSYTCEISDVTSAGGRDYTGAHTDPVTAAQLAAIALAAGNEYGRGKLVIKLPAREPFGGQQYVLNNAKRGDALARERLRDLVTVVGTVASFAGPEVGLAVAAAGAGVAADNLYDRYKQDQLDWSDPQTINDLLTIFAAASSGAGAALQRFGNIQVVQSGSRLTLRVAGVVTKAGEVAGDVQLMMAGADILDNLRKINADEAAGALTPRQAQRARAQALSAAIQMVAPMAGGVVHQMAGDVSIPEPLAGRGRRGAHEPELRRMRAPGEPLEGRHAIELEPRGARARGEPVEAAHVIDPVSEAPEAQGTREAPQQGPDLPASALGRPGSPEAAEAPRPVRPGLDPAPIPRSEAREALRTALREAGAVTENLPDGSVISNLHPSEVRRVYENCIATQPGQEAGIFHDPQSGEYVVVQGIENQIDILAVLRKDRDFANRNFRMVEHFHPGEHVLVRMPSQGAAVPGRPARLAHARRQNRPGSHG
jgi:hypothetical protein